MTKEEIRKLREQRAKAVADLRKVLDNAGTRALRADETEASDKAETDIESLDKRIAACEKALELDERDDDEDDKEEDREDTDHDGKDEDDEEDRSVKLINGRRYIPVGSGKTKPQKRNKQTGKLERYDGETDQEYSNRSRRSTVEYAKAFRSYLRRGERGAYENRAVQADSDLVGGFLVMPQQFVTQLLKFTDNLLFIRQLATKFQLATAQSLGAPTLDTDPDDADWSSELATGNEDTAMSFGKRELTPVPLAKRLKASNKLLRMATVSSTFSAYDATTGLGPIENFLMSRLAYKLTVPQERAFMVGNGVGQPLGVFTASARGISTGRDVQTGSTTDYTGDGLISAKYSLKQQYHAKSQWLLPRTGVKKVRQLKDSYGQYLWQPGLQAGAPDKLLDLPVIMSEYAPSTFTTGQYVGLLGDFSFYWIADSLEYQIQKLIELYAEANQTGFIVRAELDGMPVLEEAFARLITN